MVSHSVVPASAGVFRPLVPPDRDSRRRPRQRGGVPELNRRGCSVKHGGPVLTDTVVPASAGVFPGSRSPTQGTPSRPRQRGGVPCVLSQVSVAMMSSPPARGCSHLDQRGRPDPHVVPASAGVFRGSPSAQPRRRGRPRQRGGVPARTRVLGDGAPSSPPARGCSGPGRRPAGHRAVVPASAGVFRCCGFWWRYVAGRPRQRGGVPAYTPKPSRPRQRGGVPFLAGGSRRLGVSSPPARGCSELPQ